MNVRYESPAVAGCLSIPAEVGIAAIRQHLHEANRLGVDPVDHGLSAVASRADAVTRGGRADAAVGSAPSPALLDAFRKIVETPFRAAEGVDPAIVPQQAFSRVGYEQTQITRITVAGQVANARASGPVPRVSEEIQSEVYPITYWVNAFTIDQWESVSAINQYVDIAGQRMRAARLSHMLAMSDRTFVGDPVSGLPGILNHPYIPKTYGTLAWKANATTGVQVVADFIGALDAIKANSKGLGRPNIALMSANLVRRIRALQMSVTYPLLTVAKFLADNYGEVSIIPVESLNGAGPGGSDAVVFYNGNDPDSLFNDVPQLPTFLAPQLEGFKSHVFVWSSHAGVKAIASYNDGILFVPQS